MSKLATAFGEKFEQNKINLLTREFTLRGVTFKVRVPSVGELETIYYAAANPDAEKVEKVYQELTANLKELEKDGDVVVEGRSMREAAHNRVSYMIRITGYFKFLVPDTGASLENLEYEDIEQEFPVSVQMEFFDAINEVIAPDYKQARGKS